ncbi:MAG: T9SS type A sorting domain-containing protein [Sphingobacteriaceae bacterium]
MKQKLKNLLYQNRFNQLSNYKFILVVTLFFNLNIKSQIVNYINNGGFEDTLNGANSNPFNKVKFWGPIDTNGYGYYLFSTLIGNAPYCSTGFQQPRHGKNFIISQLFCEGSLCSIFNSRGYPRNRLKNKLTAGKTYCAKYYVVNTNNNRVAMESYGIYLADSSLDTINYCSYPLTYINAQITYSNGVITDTMNWTAIKGTYVASGNEKYMVIGNFRSNATTNTLQLNTQLSTQTADIYIDDVSLIDIDLPAYAGPDIWILPGDSAFIGRHPDVGIDEACMWYKMPNTTTAIDTVAGLWVKPSVTTSYLVRQEICGNVKWDLVTVYISATGQLEIEQLTQNLKVFPQPAQNEINLKFEIKNPDEFTEVEIFNNLGERVKHQTIEFNNKQSSIKTEDLAEGVYFLSLKNHKGITIKKRFVIVR